MAAEHVTQLADRIMAINWKGSFDRARSRGYLMKEYLRRAAWWARATKAAESWPFFDIAAAVNPAIRADPAVVARVEAHLKKNLQGVPVTRACERALHFAALQDAGIGLPQAPSHPFEPLLVMFERGGGFRIGGGGLIEVDTLGLAKGGLADNLKPDPVTQLDDGTLDELDRG